MHAAAGVEVNFISNSADKRERVSMWASRQGIRNKDFHCQDGISDFSKKE
jgi:hypothetical protein